jgi:hypothetical protein
MGVQPTGRDPRINEVSCGVETPLMRPRIDVSVSSLAAVGAAFRATGDTMKNGVF